MVSNVFPRGEQPVNTCKKIAGQIAILLACLLASQPVKRSIDQSIDRSINESVNQPTSQLATQQPNQTPKTYPPTHTLNHTLNHPSIHPSIHPPINQWFIDFFGIRKNIEYKITHTNRVTYRNATLKRYNYILILYQIRLFWTVPNSRYLFFEKWKTV